MQIILDRNPNINYRDRFDRTPLHHAALNANLTAAKLLISRGLSNPHPALMGQVLELDARSIGGETPLMKAAQHGCVDICLLLL